MEIVVAILICAGVFSLVFVGYKALRDKETDRMILEDRIRRYTS